MKVEFRPHICGYRATPTGDEAVEFDQWILMVDDGPGGMFRQAGYVEKKPGGFISFIRQFPPSEVELIHQLVEAEKGERTQPTQPPSFGDEPEDDD